MQPVHVLIPETMNDAGIRLLTGEGMVIHPHVDHVDVEELRAVVVRSVFQVDESFLERYPNLIFVGKLGTGLDNIDTEACAKKHIEVWHCPGKNAISTAEFALTMVMAHFKKLHVIQSGVAKSDYRRHLMMGRELAQLELGILGYGGVGRALSKKSIHIFKKIHVLDKNFKKDMEMNGMQYHSDLHVFLQQVDALVLAIPLKNNENLVNMEFLRNMKKNALLLNVSRGGIIHEADILDMLSKHPEFHFMTDVLTKEPDFSLLPSEQAHEHPFFENKNFTFTPHIAGMTVDCQSEIARLLAQHLIEKFKH